MDDDEKITGLVKILGENNVKKIKDEITNLIIDIIKNDIESYDKESYLIDPDDIIEFINDCKYEAFDKLKDETINNFMKQIKVKTGE